MATKTLGDVTQAMLEKRLLPTDKQGTYLLPGTDVTVRGKAAAVKALVAEASKPDATATTRNAVDQAEISQTIHDLAEEGKSQKQIADEVSMDITHVGDLLRWATADPITWSDESDLQKKVVAERDKNKTSWAGIAIRAGVTKGIVQKLYKSAGKDPHKSDIGKGGRRKDSYHTGSAKKATPKKPAAKKAVAKKPVAKKKAVKKTTTKKRVVKKGASKKTEDTPF